MWPHSRAHEHSCCSELTALRSRLTEVEGALREWRRHADEGPHGIGGLHYATCAILLNFTADADPPCDCGSWAMRDALDASSEPK